MKKINRTEVNGVERDNQVPIKGSGTLDCIHHAAAVMLHLGNLLSASDKKIRVTIECDPEKNRFEITREDFA